MGHRPHSHVVIKPDGQLSLTVDLRLYWTPALRPITVIDALTVAYNQAMSDYFAWLRESRGEG